MNMDFSQLPPEERALRLTALLLGELSAEEAEQVRQAITADAELAREFERFKQTIELVRETSAMERKVSPEGTPLRLDDSRRAKLLETFKQPAPRVEAPRRRRWHVPASIAAALVGLLMFWLMMPFLSPRKARSSRLSFTGRMDEFQEKLREGRQIEGEMAERLVDGKIQISGQAVSGLAANDYASPAVLAGEIISTPASVRGRTVTVLPNVTELNGDAVVAFRSEMAPVASYTINHLALQSEVPATPLPATAPVRSVDEYGIQGGSASVFDTAVANGQPHDVRSGRDSGRTSAARDLYLGVNKNLGEDAVTRAPASTDQGLHKVYSVNDVGYVTRNLGQTIANPLANNSGIAQGLGANSPAPVTASPEPAPKRAGARAEDLLSMSDSPRGRNGEVVASTSFERPPLGTVKGMPMEGWRESSSEKNTPEATRSNAGQGQAPVALPSIDPAGLPIANTTSEYLTSARAREANSKNELVEVENAWSRPTDGRTGFGSAVNRAVSGAVGREGQVALNVAGGNGPTALATTAPGQPGQLGFSLTSPVIDDGAVEFYNGTVTRPAESAGGVNKQNRWDFMSRADDFAWGDTRFGNTASRDSWFSNDGLADWSGRSKERAGIEGLAQNGSGKGHAGDGEPAQMATRFFSVDPDALDAGLKNVTVDSFGQTTGLGGAGGGGSFGGGGIGGFGRGGGGRSGAAQPQTAGNSYRPAGAPPARPSASVKSFLNAAGVDLNSAGKSVEYDEKLGGVTVRGTASDFDTAEKALGLLTTPAQQLTVGAKFAEVNQDGSRMNSAGAPSKADNTSVFAGGLGFTNGAHRVTGNVGLADGSGVQAGALLRDLALNTGGDFRGSDDILIPTVPNVLIGDSDTDGAVLLSKSKPASGFQFELGKDAKTSGGGIGSLSQPINSPNGTQPASGGYAFQKESKSLADAPTVLDAEVKGIERSKKQVEQVQDLQLTNQVLSAIVAQEERLKVARGFFSDSAGAVVANDPVAKSESGNGRVNVVLPGQPAEQLDRLSSPTLTREEAESRIEVQRRLTVTRAPGAVPPPTVAKPVEKQLAQAAKLDEQGIILTTNSFSFVGTNAVIATVPAKPDTSPVLNLYAQLTGKKLVKSPQLQADPKIFTNGLASLSKEDAIRALNTALAVNGVTMVSQGETFVKAVPPTTFPGEAAAFSASSAEQASETQIVPLKNLAPEEAIKILAPYSNLPRALQPVKDTSVLVLRDRPENVKRMMEVLGKAEAKAADPVPAKPPPGAPTPQPEMLTRDNAFSTFSLNVSDVSFKLAAASLEKGGMPDATGIRSEEFLNAFDYRDPLPPPGVPVAFAWERARYPFAHNRDALRFSVKTAAQGRDGGRPLNIVLLIDNSGSMERADRVRIIQESLRTLADQLQPQDKLSVVSFSRTPTLRADGVSGAKAIELAKQIGALTPEGGTNLEDAMDLAYRTALKHYAATAINRVVLLTDGAANLGNVEPKALKAKVEGFRKQGVALDCFGIGWDGFNDDLLEQLSRNGDGRYGYINAPEEAATEFAGQLAGALRVAASDVKVQVEFNPKRVTAYRQVGYAKHQLTKQQFRDNTVDAAEIGASEAGNGLYIIETNPRGEGPIATVRARFRVPQTSDYREHEWVVPYGSAVDVEQSSTAMRLATSASAFSEWLASSPFSGEVTTDRLLSLMSGVPEVFGADTRPKKLEWMIRQAKSISGK